MNKISFAEAFKYQTCAYAGVWDYSCYNIEVIKKNFILPGYDLPLYFYYDANDAHYKYKETFYYINKKYEEVQITQDLYHLNSTLYGSPPPVYSVLFDKILQEDSPKFMLKLTSDEIFVMSLKLNEPKKYLWGGAFEFRIPMDEFLLVDK